MRFAVLLCAALITTVSAQDLRLPQKWVVQARLFDAKTGAVASEPYLVSDIKKPFPRAQDCDAFLRNLGPVPVHDGKFIVFRCYRLDAQDEKDT